MDGHKIFRAAIRVAVIKLTATNEQASGHVARHQTFANTRISIETKRDNAQMRSIALMTMIYLPLTSVAVSVIFNTNIVRG